MQSAETSSAAVADAQSNLASITPNDVSLPREDNGVQDVVDQFFQPVKVTFFLFLYPKVSNFVPSVLWMNLLFFLAAYTGADG